MNRVDISNEQVKDEVEQSLDIGSVASVDSHSQLELHRVHLLKQEIKKSERVDGYDLVEYMDDGLPVNFNVIFG